MLWIWCFALLCSLKCVVLCVLTPVVELRLGKLRGFHVQLTDQYKYLGVPYAVAKRFQPPQPPAPWKGILNTINPAATCPQAISFLILGSEDCLYLDIHTPAQPSHPLPVMVFIHGGAYYHGAKFHYDPAFLVSHGVIVVIVNYRLGVLGFLCLNGVSNLGIKDQIAALQWIKENIKNFGGDPYNVTLFGQSAGASAVGMHFLTNSSKGLFHKAILQSGTPISPWAFTIDPIDSSVKDAEALGAKNREEKEIYETFYNATLYDLLVATKDTSINTKRFKYSPCIDGELFTDAPYNIIKSGMYNEVPIIVGQVDNEGLLFYGLNNDQSLKDLDENFYDKLPAVFDSCSLEDKLEISAKIRTYYFENKTIDKDLTYELSNYYGDWLAYATGKPFIELLSTSIAPVYSYLFTYEGERNLGKFWFTPNAKIKGASHTDDVFYIFKPLGIPMILTTQDKLIIDRVTVMWTNFAKTGNPTPARTRLLPLTWKSVQDSRQVLRIDRNLQMVDLADTKDVELFRQLLCQFGQSGYVPCETGGKCK